MHTQCQHGPQPQSTGRAYSCPSIVSRPCSTTARLPRRPAHFRCKCSATHCRNTISDKSNATAACQPQVSGQGGGCTTGEDALPRRAVLTTTALLASLGASSWPSGTAAAGLTTSQAAAAMRAGNVVPALPPSGYLRLIAASRPAAVRTVSAQIEEGRFGELSSTLVLPPVDDLRQAAFFLPYALLATAPDSALAAKEAYNELLARLKALDGAAIAAARYEASEGDVATALAAFLTALDGVVAAASGQKSPAASA